MVIPYSGLLFENICLLLLIFPSDALSFVLQSLLGTIKLMDTLFKLFLFPYFLSFVPSKYILGFSEFLFEIFASRLEVCFLEIESLVFSGKLIPFFRYLFYLALKLSEFLGLSLEF